MIEYFGRTAMRFSYGIKEIVAACVLSCLIAAAAVAMTTPGTAGGAAAAAVERSLKGDRLPQAPLTTPTQRSSDNSSATKTETKPQRTPLGCDPAFSPVAEPTRAHYFNRCMV
jgi:hypothetical protein